MPKLWNDTIEAHRRSVRDAILETTAALVAEHGLRGVTMSQIAWKTGIGRATLYKYFSDADAILRAWHERELRRHLHHLVQVRDHGGDARERLEAVLEAYALSRRQAHGLDAGDLGAMLHRGKHVLQVERQVHGLIRAVLAEAAANGTVRGDVSADELASYCLHALTAATRVRSKAAVKRLVGVTLDGLRTSS